MERGGRTAPAVSSRGLPLSPVPAEPQKTLLIATASEELLVSKAKVT